MRAERENPDGALATVISVPRMAAEQGTLDSRLSAFDDLAPT